MIKQLFFILVFTFIFSCSNEKQKEKSFILQKSISSTFDSTSDDVVSQFDYANKLVAEKKYAKAIQIFSNQIKINPSLSALYENRAVAFNQINKYDSAIKDVTIAMNLSQTNISLLNLRSEIKYNANYFKDAIADCDSVIGIKPDFAEAYFTKGLALLKLNSKDEACGYFKQSLKHGNRNAEKLIEENCK